MRFKIVKALFGLLLGVAFLFAAGLLYLNSSPGRDFLAGYLGSQLGQTVRIDGDVSLGWSPAALEATGVSVEAPSGGKWLSVEVVRVQAPTSLWPPGAEDPVELLVSGAVIHSRQLLRAWHRRDAGDRTRSTPVAPFPLRFRVVDSTVDGLPRGLNSLRVREATLAIDPARGARFSLKSSLGPESLASELTATFDATSSSTAAELSGWIDLAGLTLATRGTIDDYRSLQGIDLKLTAAGQIAERAGVSGPFSGERIRGRLTGDRGALTFDMSEMAAATEHGNFRLSALIRQETGGLIMEHGDLSIEADDLSAFLGEFGIRSQLSLPAALEARLDGDADGVNIEQLALDLAKGEIFLGGSGRVSRDRSSDGGATVAAELSVNAADIATLISGFGVESPVRGPLTGVARIAGPLKRLSIEGVKLDLGTGAVTATGGGEFSIEEGWPELDLPFEAKAVDLVRVYPKVPLASWFGTRGRALASLRFGSGGFSLVGLSADFDGKERHARLTGDIDHLRDLTAPRLHAVLESTRSEGEATGLEALDLSVSLPTGLDAAGTVELSGEAGQGSFSFAGGIGAPRRLGGISGDFRFTASEAFLHGKGPGAEGVTVLSGRLDIEDLKSRRFALLATLEGTPGSVSYEGQLDEDLAGSGQLKVEGVDVDVLAALVGATTDIPNPARFEGSLRHDAEGVYVDQFVLFTGASEIDGQLAVRFAASTTASTAVVLKATSPELYLVDLGLDGKAEDEDHYFSRAPLGLESLKGMDLDLSIEVEALHSEALNYQDMKLTGTSRGGVLELTSSQQLLGGGSSRLEVSVDATGERPEVHAEAKLEGIDPGELRALKESKDKYSGDVDVELDITGQGDSVQEILSHANGYFLLRVNHAVLPNRELNLLSADFLFEIVRIVNPFNRQANEMEIDCGLVAFAIRDGTAIADNSIVIKGKRLLVAGEGRIDLGTEKVALVIRPKAQEGIGLNTSGLVKFIGIGGTLAKPEFKTDPKGLLMTGATLGAAVASGGMSFFLQNIFDRLTSGNKECEGIEAVFRDRLTRGPEEWAPPPPPVLVPEARSR